MGQKHKVRTVPTWVPRHDHRPPAAYHSTPTQKYQVGLAPSPSPLLLAPPSPPRPLSNPTDPPTRLGPQPAQGAEFNQTLSLSLPSGVSEGEFVTLHVRVLDRHLKRTPRTKAAGATTTSSSPEPHPDPRPSLVKDHELGLLHLRARVGLAQEPKSHPLLTTRWAKGYGTLDLGWGYSSSDVAQQAEEDEDEIDDDGAAAKERKDKESALLMAPDALLY